ADRIKGLDDSAELYIGSMRGYFRSWHSMEEPSDEENVRSSASTKQRLSLERNALLGVHMVRIALAAAFCLLASSAGTQSTAPRKVALSEDIRFCPSWAEAHERTMASLNDNGR